MRYSFVFHKLIHMVVENLIDLFNGEKEYRVPRASSTLYRKDRNSPSVSPLWGLNNFPAYPTLRFASRWANLSPRLWR
jgi:hypothetical protein